MKIKKIKAVVKAAPKYEQIPVSGEFIKLDSFLKLANAVSTGGEAKIRIQGGEVLVNDEVCIMRGKKLRPGDRVRIGSERFEVTAESDQ